MFYFSSFTLPFLTTKAARISFSIQYKIGSIIFPPNCPLSGHGLSNNYTPQFWTKVPLLFFLSKQLMNSFLYLISVLHLCSLPVTSPHFPIFLKWQLCCNCMELLLTQVYDQVSLLLSVWLSHCISWYPVVTNFMCIKRMIFYLMNGGTILEHVLLLPWTHSLE